MMVASGRSVARPTEPSPLPDAAVENSSARLEGLAKRICGRDHLAAMAHRNWFDSGNDLAAAKKLLTHGEFEPWCKSNLNYSKSKAEKLMQAAATFRPHLESVNATDFPRASIAYKLSAPSTPPTIRDEFLRRALAGEKIGPDLARALKAFRTDEAPKDTKLATVEEISDLPDDSARILVSSKRLFSQLSAVEDDNYVTVKLRRTPDAGGDICFAAIEVVSHGEDARRLAPKRRGSSKRVEIRLPDWIGGTPSRRRARST